MVKVTEKIKASIMLASYLDTLGFKNKYRTINTRRKFLALDAVAGKGSQGGVIGSIRFISALT